MKERIIQLDKLLGPEFNTPLGSTPLEHLSDKWNIKHLISNSSIVVKPLSIQDAPDKVYDKHAFYKSRAQSQPRSIRNIRMKQYASQGGSCFGLDISRDSVTGELVLLLRIWILHPSQYFKTILPADVYTKEYTSDTYADFGPDIQSLDLKTEIEAIFTKLEKKAKMPKTKVSLEAVN